MTPALRILCGLSLLGLCACGNSPTGASTALPFVSATNSCAPTDAPAVSITLSAKPVTGNQVDQPFLTVSLWAAFGDLPGRTFRLAQGSADGFGRYYADNDPRAGSVTGTVGVHGVARDSSIIGSIDVRLTDGTRLTREFVAPWQPTRMRCG